MATLADPGQPTTATRGRARRRWVIDLIDDRVVVHHIGPLYE